MKREIKKAMLQTAFAILGIYAANCYAGNDYTVKTVNGVPIVHMNDKPIRTRMFYTNVPGFKFDEVGTEWKKVSLPFTANDNAPAEVQLNFAARIKNIEISELYLVDKSDNSKVPLFDFAKNPAKIKSNWTVKALEA